MKIFLTLLFTAACCLCLSAQSKNAEKAFNKGLDYFQEQAYTEALDQFKSVIWADPDHEAAHHFLAQIYTEQGKISYAIKHLKRVLAINSNREDSWVELSKAYAANDQSDKAIATLEKAIKINNDFLSAKLELEHMLHPPIITESEIVEEAIAYETKDLEVQPLAAPQMVSISDEPSILLEKPLSTISSVSMPIVIPVFDKFEEVVAMEPIAKEEVMAPAPARERSKKAKKEKKESAGASEKEDMSADLLNELLPAFEAEASLEEVVIEEKIEEIDEVLSKEEVVINVTTEETESVVEAEVTEEEEVLPVQEEIVPAFSSTPRIPGIRMPSAIDHVIKSQEKTKRTRKHKN